jgi:hypothetical protein
MFDLNIFKVFPRCSEKLYPNKGKFAVEQLLKADMVKSAFSAGKRVEHMWVKVFEVQVENQLVKGTRQYSNRDHTSNSTIKVRCHDADVRQFRVRHTNQFPL